MTLSEKINKACEIVQPEAKELCNSLLGDKLATTKDNYGRLMAFIGNLDKLTQAIMLEAVIREGYPRDTGYQVADILNIKKLGGMV